MGTIPGRCIDSHPEVQKHLQPGDYGWNSSDGNWYARVPTDASKNLTVNLGEDHFVTEHRDGTITVAPEIQVSDGDAWWKGNLKHGIWDTL